MGYHPQAFQGDVHSISVREVQDNEFYKTRNIALNSHDLRVKTGAYPHAGKVQAESEVVAKWNEYMQDVMEMQMDERTGAQPLLEQVFYLR